MGKITCLIMSIPLNEKVRDLHTLIIDLKNVYLTNLQTNLFQDLKRLYVHSI